MTFLFQHVSVTSDAVLVFDIFSLHIVTLVANSLVGTSAPVSRGKRPGRRVARVVVAAAAAVVALNLVTRAGELLALAAGGAHGDGAAVELDAVEGQAGDLGVLARLKVDEAKVAVVAGLGVVLAGGDALANGGTMSVLVFWLDFPGHIRHSPNAQLQLYISLPWFPHIFQSAGNGIYSPGRVGCK